MTFRVSWLSILLLLLPAGGCAGEGSAQSGVDKQAALAARRVTVAPVVRKDFEREVLSTGSLIPRDTAVLRALVSGPVVEIPVDLGDRVRAGEVVFQVRPQDARLALESAQASLETARAHLADLKAWRRIEELRALEAEVARAESEMERLEKEKERSATLLEKGAISRSEWDRDRSAAEVAAATAEMARQQLGIARQGPTPEQLEVARGQAAEAEARVAAARQQFEDTAVRAPYPGVIVGRFQKVGDYVSRGQEVVEIANLSYLEGEMKIVERYSDLINVGIPVDLSIESINTTLTGEVIAVNPSIDRETRTFLVKVGLPNPDLAIKAGAFCSGRFRLPPLSGVLAVPIRALQSQEGQSFVWIAADETASRRFIRTGERGAEFIAVLEGLSEGEQVVIEGAGALSPGDSLEVTEGPSSEAT